MVIKSNDLNQPVIYYDLSTLKKEFPELTIEQFEMNYDEAFSLFYNQGNIVYEDYSPEKAILYFEEALRFDATNNSAWNKLGTSYGDLKKYHKAIECYKNMLGLSEDDSTALTNIGVDYIELGDYDKAIKYYLKALALDSTNHLALTGLGNAHCFKNTEEDYDKAIDYYDKALAIKEHTHIVWNNIGAIYTYRKEPQLDLALKCFNKSIEIEPFFAEGWFNKGSLYYNLQEYKIALEAINKCLSINPNYVNALMIKGQINSNIRKLQ